MNISLKKSKILSRHLIKGVTAREDNMGGGDRSSCPETFRCGSLVVNQVTVT